MDWSQSVCTKTKFEKGILIFMSNNNLKSRKYLERILILNLNTLQILFAVVMGVVGVFLFLFLFPGGAITTAMHQVLNLPGPGAGIGLIFGPFIIILSLLTYNSICKHGVIFITCLVFGLFHSILTPIVYPDVKTVGSLGPIYFRVLAVILVGIALEICIFLLKNRKDIIKYLISAGISNIILLSFYWVAIFPYNKGIIKIEDIPILLGITIIAAIILGGLVPLGVKRLVCKN